jgi:hypothetical protein
MNKLPKRNRKMTPILLTGMARSGTTLLDKLLSSHDKILAASQPLPWLYRHLKAVFYESRNIKTNRYVLNDLFNESRYTPEEFNEFLDKYSLKRKDLHLVFQTMKDWSGRKYEDYDVDKLIEMGENETLTEFYRLFLKHIVRKNDSESTVCGTKEIIIEEFVPYFVKHGIKSIIIVRDPRDVITSLNVGSGEKYSGVHRPTLFHLRNWRKSIAIANSVCGSILLVKYEDLLGKTYETLNKITDFLGLDSFPKGFFSNGIRDANGNLWSGNSSTVVHRGINSNNVGKFERYLTTEMIEYVEYYCKPEMKLLGYKLVGEMHKPVDFQEQFEIGVQDLDANMSVKPDEVFLEDLRLNLISNRSFQDDSTIRKLFYSMQNFKRLTRN